MNPLTKNIHLVFLKIPECQGYVHRVTLTMIIYFKSIPITDPQNQIP